MLNGNPFAGVDCAAGGGGGGPTVVPAPVFPWIWDCAGTLLASLVVEAAELATASLAAAGGVEMASPTAAAADDDADDGVAASLANIAVSLVTAALLDAIETAS
jgi:hypothetical protein